MLSSLSILSQEWEYFEENMQDLELHSFSNKSSAEQSAACMALEMYCGSISHLIFLKYCKPCALAGQIAIENWVVRKTWKPIIHLDVAQPFTWNWHYLKLRQCGHDKSVCTEKKTCQYYEFSKFYNIILKILKIKLPFPPLLFLSC